MIVAGIVAAITLIMAGGIDQTAPMLGLITIAVIAQTIHDHFLEKDAFHRGADAAIDHICDTYDVYPKGYELSEEAKRYYGK